MNLYENIKTNLKEADSNNLDMLNSELSKDELQALYDAWVIKEGKTKSLDNNFDEFKEFLNSGDYLVDERIKTPYDFAFGLLEDAGLYEFFGGKDKIADIADFIRLNELKEDYPDVTKDRLINIVNNEDAELSSSDLYDYFDYQKFGEHAINNSKVFMTITKNGFVEIQ